MEIDKKKESGEFVWILPLVAGICTVIAILTPTASYTNLYASWYWWMWNFSCIFRPGDTPINFFFVELDFIIPSIVTTITLLLSAINLFILSNTTKKRKFSTKDFVLMSITSAGLTIFIMIYYAFAMRTALIDGFTIGEITFAPGYLFWSEFSPSFGMILSFISVIISIIGAGIFKHYSNKRYYILPSTRDVAHQYVPPKVEPVTQYIPVIKSAETRMFCHECGKKVIRVDVKFCTRCGAKF